MNEKEIPKEKIKETHRVKYTDWNTYYCPTCGKMVSYSSKVCACGQVFKERKDG